MDLQQKAHIALTVLLTGLVVVFLMLIILTLIIKGYGSAVSSISKKLKARRDKKNHVENIEKTGKSAEVQPADISLPEKAENGISQEVVAAITAAVCCTIPNGRIKSLRRAKNQSNTAHSAWNMAGRLNNTHPF